MVDGIITMPLDSDADSINLILDKNIPVVLIDRPVKGINCDVVLDKNGKVLIPSHFSKSYLSNFDFITDQ